VKRPTFAATVSLVVTNRNYRVACDAEAESLQLAAIPLGC
jgi:hypothetical protein